MSNNSTPSQDSTSTASTVTASEENGWIGIAITAKGLNDSAFNAGSVSHNVVGGVKEIGVVGNTTPGNAPPTPELGYNPVTKQSEQIQAVFDSPVNSIKVGVDLFFGSENGSGEIGQWTAYDAHGKVVGCDTFKNSAGSSIKEISIQTDTPFTKIVFSALPYANQGSFKGDSSDYSITYIKYNNHTPEACDDVNSVKEDTAPNPISGNVLTNDHDSDGNTLSVTNAGIFTLDHGTLVIKADGTYTYTLNNSDPAVNALNNGQTLKDSFTYKISDGHMGTDSAKLTITINGSTDNRPPVVCVDTNTIKEDAVPNKVMGNVLTNDSDPDGNPLTVTNVSGATTYGSIEWHADGSYTYTLDNSKLAVNALNNGDKLFDTISYTVSDGHGGTSTSTLTIRIDGSTDNRPPVVCVDTNTIKEDAIPNTVSGNVLTNDSDPDGNPLTVTNVSGATTYGSIEWHADGSYTYTLDNSKPAVNALNNGDKLFDTISYTVSDGHGGTSTSTLTIRIDGSTDNRPPVVCVDTNTIKEDAMPNTVSGNVLTNDSDPDGNPLTVTNVSGATTYGSIEWHADGSYTYTLDNSKLAVNALNNGDKLFDTISYTVSDGHGGTSTSTLTIRIDGSTDNRPPVVCVDTNTIKEDAVPNKVMGNVLTNDSDPDGNPLTVTNVSGATTYGSIEWHADGSYTYTLDNSKLAVNALNNGDKLFDTISYTVSDGHGGTSTSTLTIRIDGSTDNRPPVVCVDTNTIKEDAVPNKVMGNVLTNDSDPDGNPLTVTNVSGATTYGSIEWHADGSYTYTLDNSKLAVNALNNGDKLFDTISYTVSDGHGGTSTSTLTIRIDGSTDNRPPVVCVDTNTIKEDAVPNKVMGNVLTNDSDPDGNPLTVTNVSGATTYGSIEWHADGSYTYTLDNSKLAVNALNNGDKLFDTISYTVSDGHGGTSTSTLTIRIDGSTDNRPPVVCVDTNTIKEDAVPNKVMGNVLTNDSDPDGNPLTVTNVSGATTYGSIEWHADGSYTYTLDNSKPAVNALNNGDHLSDTISYTVSDGHGGTSTSTLTIRIDGSTDNRPPVVCVDTNTIKEDAMPNTVSGNVLTNDSDPDGNPLTVTNVSGATTYGSIEWHADGSYTYTLDNSKLAVNALNNGDKLFDTISYTVSDGHGGTSTSTLTIRIDGSTDNRPPVVCVDTNTIKEDAVPNKVMGNVLTNDSDPDGNPLTVTNVSGATTYGFIEWHADGSYTYTLDNSKLAVNALNNGDKLFDTISYTVSDGHGGTSTSTLTIRIDGSTDNRPPVVCVDTNTIKEDAVPNKVMGNVLTNDSDPDGNPLTVTNVSGATTYGSIEWHADGSYTYTLDNSKPAVNALNNGDHLSDTISYTVSDGHGGTSTSTLTIRIDGSTDNRPPVVCVDTNTIKEDAMPNTVSGNVLTNDSDPDGNPLTVTNVSGATTYGSIEWHADGSYTYTLDNSKLAVNALNNGDKLFDTISYTVSDGHGGTSTSTLTIRIDGSTDNRPPVVCVDTNTIKEDAVPNKVMGNVLTNDSDPDGNPLTVTNVSGATTYGSIEWHADGSYTYTLDNSKLAVNALNNGDKLFDTISYTVSDGHGGTSTSTLTIRIDGSTDNRPPVVCVDTNTIKEDAVPNKVMGNVLTNDSDPDGNPLTVTNVSGATTYGSIEWHADGSYTYTLDNSKPAVNALNNGDHLSDTISYTVSDGHGGTSTSTLTIRIDGSTDNRPPVVCVDTNTIKEDAMPNTVSGNVLTNDSDPDGNPLTVTNVSGATTYGSIEWHADGSYTYTLDNSKPAVNALNNGDKLFDTISYTVSDGHGGTSTSTLTIRIDGSTDNRPPVVCVDTNTIKEDAVPNKVMGNVLTNDSDPDGNPLTVTNVSGATTYGSIEWHADGSYTYTLDNSKPAVNALNNGDKLFDTISYTVSDGHGGTSTSTLTIRIDGSTDNRPPVVCVDTNTIKEDAVPNKVMGNVLTNDSDPDGNPLTVTNVSGATTYGSIEWHADGSYTYTLDNSKLAVNALNNGDKLFDTISYTVSDGHGGTSTSTLTIRIDGSTDNRPPVACADTASVKEDAAPNPISGNVLTNDTDLDGHTLMVTNAGTFTSTYGTLVLNANGTYSYTLDNSKTAVNDLKDGDVRTDSFTYKISDGHGGTDSATLNITINGSTDNRPPVAHADTASIKEDMAPSPVTGNVLANDTDADGNALSVTNAGTFTLAHGTLVLHADGSYAFTLDNSNPAVNALNDGQKLTDSFIYHISDGHGGTDSASLTVTINGTTDEPTCGCHCGSTPPGAPTDALNHVAFGTVRGDTIHGLDDTINTIYAGAGNDTVTGGDDATNIIYAEAGKDLIKGGFHSINELYGDDRDLSGQNHLIGGDCSVNTIFGGGGDATIDGGNMNSINTLYAGGGTVTMHGGNDSTNTMYAEWGNGVVITGGDHAENTFFDGGGNATYWGGAGDNLFVFNDLKYPVASQGLQNNKVYPVALFNQDVSDPHTYEFVSKGTDTVHGNADSTNNVLGLIGRLDKETWSIKLDSSTPGHQAEDGSWVAQDSHNTLSGTIISKVTGAVITFDTINKIEFLS